MTHTTNKIHAAYNADHDVNPDPQAPRVTWAENGLADDVDALLRKIIKLEERINELESDVKGLEIRDERNHGGGR